MTTQNHLNVQQINRYRDESVSIQERRQIEDHIEDCDECREWMCDELNIYQGIADLIADLLIDDLEEDNHFDCEQLTDYVDGRLDATDRGIADSHFEFCEMCAREMRDLLAFKKELEIACSARTLLRGVSGYGRA